MIELEDDDEDFQKPVTKPPVEYTFNITRREALSFLQSQISTYEQFDGFKPSHPSYKKLKYTAAVYKFIMENL